MPGLILGPQELTAPTDEEWEFLLSPKRLERALEDAKKQYDALDEKCYSGSKMWCKLTKTA